MMDYKDYIRQKREKWIGKRVRYEGKEYNVIGVDYNGLLLIDKKSEFKDDTALEEWMVEVL
jgi:hypothetical protein